VNVDDRYVKFVNKTIAKIETILKLILTAKDPPAGLVQNYFFLIADKSVTNFLKVLELKVHPNETIKAYIRAFENKNKTLF
jgi:vacuolar protein sorting-associated protein 53